MPISPYYRGLRERLGTQLLLIPAVAAVVRDERGRVLVQRTHAGDWSLPAGAIEPGEAPAEAVAREVYEETGLCVRAERVLGVVGGRSCRVTYANGARVEAVVTVFECERVSGELIEANDETAELCWFKVDEMPALAVPYPEEILAGGRERAFFDSGTGVPCAEFALSLSPRAEVGAACCQRRAEPTPWLPDPAVRISATSRPFRLPETKSGEGEATKAPSAQPP